MKVLKKFENFNNNKKIKISYFKLKNKKVYATMKSGLGYSVKINGVEADGFFSPIWEYAAKGIDTNELWVNDKKITITVKGGGHRTYPIAIWDLPEKEKQPKNLSFTGPYHDTSKIGTEFKKQLLNIIETHPDWLSDEFKETFGI